MDTAVRTGDRGAGLDRETLLLGAGDVGLLTGLILFGQQQHDTLGDPLTSLETVAPFVLGWLAMALLAGIYTRGLSASPIAVARVTTITWIAAANVGLILRTSSYFEGTTTWPFSLVITGFGLLVLVGWRVGYATIVRTRR